MAVIEARRGTDGRASYRAKVRLKGHPPQTATFERKTDAKRWAQQTEAAIREGRHFKTAEAKRKTLADLIDRYEREVLPHKGKATRINQGAQLRWWRDQLGAYALADITPARITEALASLTCSPPTRNRYFAALSHAFTVAVNHWEWLEASPTRKIRKHKENKPRARFLSPEERQRLLAVCKKSRNPLLYPAVVLALSTGMRQGEQFGLTWNQVDLKRGRILLEDTKNGERRAVPLTGHALEVLRGMVRRIDSPYVFPSEDGKSPIDLRTAWRNAFKKAELEDFKWHDLRHTFASELAMSGATLAELAEALGHKTLQMVKRYAHLTEGHTSKVVERMTTRLFS
jgi:integrase